MSRRTYVNNASNRSLGRVGMSHGSCVQSSSSSYSSSSSTSGHNYGSSSSSSTPQRTYVDNAANRSSGRVGEPVGSHVIHGSTSGSSSTASAPKTYVDNSQNQRLGRVGEPLGSHVVSATSSTTPTPQKTYVDNSENRRLGRVGKPLGSHVVRSDGSVSISAPGLESASGTYVDNKLNRKLGRVGKPWGEHVVHKDGSVTVTNRERERDFSRTYNLEEILLFLRGLDISDPVYPVLTNVQYKLQRNEVEESWKEAGIVPSTDHLIASENKREIIPLSEIKRNKKIGVGGFGKVYAGLWKNTPIAFKKFSCQQVSKKTRDMLVKEIKVFSALDHPNIVKMFGVVAEEGCLGIVMEYLPKTLFSAIFIEEVKFTVCEKRKIVSEVVAAIEYLHTSNEQNPIAHCDIKNQNILLDDKNVVKLCDFGLSAVKSAQASSSRTCATPGQGTPRYAAPEVLRGEVLRMTGLMMADVYSLSLTIYEILAEKEPFEALNHAQLIANVGHQNLRPPLEETNLTQAVKELLTKGWAGDASRRPSITAFSEELLKVEFFFVK